MTSAVSPELVDHGATCRGVKVWCVCHFPFVDSSPEFSHAIDSLSKRHSFDLYNTCFKTYAWQHMLHMGASTCKKIMLLYRPHHVKLVTERGVLGEHGGLSSVSGQTMVHSFPQTSAAIQIIEFSSVLAPSSDARSP